MKLNIDQEQLVARGVHLLPLCKQINAEERQHAISTDRFVVLPEDFQYTDAVVAQLDIIAEVCPGLTDFYNTQEDWPTVVYLLKHLFRAKYARQQFEEIQFLLGDGKNGKGYFMYLCQKLFGDYCHCAART